MQRQLLPAGMLVITISQFQAFLFQPASNLGMILDHVLALGNILAHIEQEVRFLEGLAPGHLASAGPVTEHQLPFPLADGKSTSSRMVDYRVPLPGP